METNITDHHHHHLHHQQQRHPTPPPYFIYTNGLLPSPSSAAASDGGGNHLLFSPPQKPSPASSPPAKKKRGRPRKYGTPEQALAARKSAASSSCSPSVKERKEKASFQQQQHKQGAGNSDDGVGKSSYGSKKSMTQLSSLGNAGHGFIPHVIAVAAGEDVAQKVMQFTQQSKREICILSASGSISNVSLRQPSTTGGIITVGGRFEIVTLSGSYVGTPLGGRTGGLSVCLSSPDGLIIGGRVGGPLTAAGPVQVIIGSFIIDMKKDYSSAATDDVPDQVAIFTPLSQYRSFHGSS